MKSSFDPMKVGKGFSKQVSTTLETSYLDFKRKFHDGHVHVEPSDLSKKIW